MTSQEGTAIAITHITKEQPENLTSEDEKFVEGEGHFEHSCELQHQKLSKAKDTSSTVANCSTRKGDSEMTIDSPRTKLQLRRPHAKVKSIIKVRQKLQS